MIFVIAGLIIKYVVQWAKIAGIVIAISLTLYALGLLPNDPVLNYINHNAGLIASYLVYINYISYSNVVFHIANFLVITFPVVWLARIIMNHIGTKEKG
jgi:hypothetical protein